MAGETPITVVGNLTADPELRFTPSGAAVANFTVASTPRTFDRQTNDWKDGEALFLNCSVWRQAAENAAESLTRGMRVIVSGRLKARSYETREGEKRTVFEIDVDEVGPSMKYATAKVHQDQPLRRRPGLPVRRRRRPVGQQPAAARAASPAAASRAAAGAATRAATRAAGSSPAARTPGPRPARAAARRSRRSDHGWSSTSTPRVSSRRDHSHPSTTDHSGSRRAS